MKRFWSGVVAAAVVTTVGVGAQGAAQGGSSQAGQTGRTAGQKIMVTGCIERAPAATATSPGGAQPGAAAGSTQQFVLANAKMASGAGVAGGAVGTTGAAANRYELDGDAKTLTSHVNQQVEITGMLEAPTPGTTGAAGTAGAKTPSPRLKVDSVKMVSATCK